MNAGRAAWRVLFVLLVTGVPAAGGLATPFEAVDAPGDRFASSEQAHTLVEEWKSGESALRRDASPWAIGTDQGAGQVDYGPHVRQPGSGSGQDFLPASSLANGEDALNQRNTLLESLMRDFSLTGMNPAALPGSGTRRRDAAAQSEVFDSLLKMVRESILEVDQSASFSLAGVDVSLNLRDGRRSLNINGIELFDQSLNAARSDGAWQALKAVDVSSRPEIVVPATAAVPVSEGALSPAALIARIREVVLQPPALIAVIVVLGLWVVAGVYRSARDRQRW